MILEALIHRRVVVFADSLCSMRSELSTSRTADS